VEIDLLREVIAASPGIDELGRLDRDYERRLHAHYHRPAYWEER
jgi:hypothetical protein